VLRQSLFRARRPRTAIAENLSDLALGEEAVVEALDLPESSAQRLQELGFIPGGRVVAARSAPGGDPRVYRVDGAEVALRRETASRVKVRDGGPGGDGR